MNEVTGDGRLIKKVEFYSLTSDMSYSIDEGGVISSCEAITLKRDYLVIKVSHKRTDVIPLCNIKYLIIKY